MNSSEIRKWNTHQTTPEVDQDQPKHKKIYPKKVIKKGLSKGEKYLYIAFSILLIVVSAYIVSYASQSDTMNRQLQTFEEKVENQQYINEGLTFEVKELSRPERITKIAKEKGLKIQDTEVKQANRVND